MPQTFSGAAQTGFHTLPSARRRLKTRVFPACAAAVSSLPADCLFWIASKISSGGRPVCPVSKSLLSVPVPLLERPPVFATGSEPHPGGWRPARRADRTPRTSGSASADLPRPPAALSFPSVALSCRAMAFCLPFCTRAAPVVARWPETPRLLCFLRRTAAFPAVQM